jgi:hypothetical protein
LSEPRNRRKPRPTAENRAVADAPRADREPEAAPKESRSEQRAAAVRADLEPLAPGELPPALAAAIAVAALLGLVNLIAYAAGVKISGRHPGPGILSFSAVMAIAVWGLVRRRYWAVLGFQALVALTVLYFCLLLIVASNVAALAICLVVIGSGSWLFWKLVRVMARIQAPPTSTSP